jgi:pimeloyl-ACP methyl ester carboxylesterase
MERADINNTSIAYFEAGNGEPLVFVHGSASDYRTWQSQRDKFAERYRVLTYSRRYHWPNEPIKEGTDYSMDKQVDDLQAFLHLLDATPAHLVGHSYGAFICLLLAMREPHLVRSLVLAEPPVITLFVSNTPKPLELLKLLMTRPRTATAIIKLGVTGLGPATAAARKNDMAEAMRLFGTAVLGHQAYHRLSEARKEQVRVNLIKAEFLGSGFPPLEAQHLRGTQIPTLLITGQSSPHLFHRLTDRLEELLQVTERVEIPDASHMMHEDNADAYNTAVLTFLEKHRGT